MEVERQCLAVEDRELAELVGALARASTEPGLMKYSRAASSRCRSPRRARRRAFAGDLEDALLVVWAEEAHADAGEILAQVLDVLQGNGRGRVMYCCTSPHSAVGQEKAALGTW